MKLNIIDIDNLGRGLAKNDGKICFVNKALPNEIVESKIIVDNKKYQEGKVLEVLTKSDQRITSFCPYSKDCDGCSFDITSYENSLKLKEQAIINSFKYANIPLNNFKIEANPKKREYRNKISLQVKKEQVGYFEENTHNFIPIKYCPLAKECLNEIIKDFNLFKFNEGKLTIRCNYNNEILIIIDTLEEIKINEELFKKHKIAGIIKNKQVIYQEPFFYERRNGLLYKVSYDAFFQVNDLVSEGIVKDVLKQLSSDDVILDLYCGVGFFSLSMALKVKEVVGIEVVKNAVIDACKNKELNKINNVNFLLGKVEYKVSKINKKFSKVLVDPPRNGLDKKTINFLLKEQIPTIIYVSCNPKTLIRDLNKLTTKYKLVTLKGYDMFSYTKHTECLCILNIR